MIDPTLISRIFSFWSYAPPFALHSSAHMPQPMHFSGSMEYINGTAWGYRTNMAFLTFVPSLYSSTASIGHFWAQLPQPVHFEGSTLNARCFTVTVKQRAFRVDPSKCTGCGSCAQKCPIEAVDEYNEGTKVRKAIFVRYPQAVPLIYSVDPEKCIGRGICAEECKAKAVAYDQKEKILEIKVGSIILSPGFDEFNARLKTEYG